MSIARIGVPFEVKRGDVFTVKTMIAHVMESGHRRDSAGRVIPRMIVNKVACTYNGRTVFEADWHGAVSSNPYLAFDLRAKDPGIVEVTWSDDDGKVYREQAALNVV
ncbi:MAG TPA: thiosulfate oxidation carrier complex protein SoxZ [Candidatus Cybelea sp.]|nr:thiosulfate oxidation carrier complex protein SoxZ [Candidatus Cybelea sp.]